MPIRKKSGEIKLCIDLININKVSLKDNYPFPKMEHILQKVVLSKRISTMDGFSGYNQIKVLHEDKEKTSFTTPWGTFMYAKIPFGLMNAGTTFQRAMDIAFVEEKYKFVVVYMDDITVYSRSDREHIRHLEKVFLKCKRYGISLNPRKSHFALEEGKLLEHIISKDGIKIDPKRISAILKDEEPRSKRKCNTSLDR